MPLDWFLLHILPVSDDQGCRHRRSRTGMESLTGSSSSTALRSCWQRLHGRGRRSIKVQPQLIDAYLRSHSNEIVALQLQSKFRLCSYRPKYKYFG